MENLTIRRDIMNSKQKRVLLKNIRHSPKQFYNGRKSIGALNTFLSGYHFRCKVEAWEKSTGHDFFKHFYAAVRLKSEYEPFGSYDSAIDYIRFAEFVHSYYGKVMSAKNGAMLIEEMCNSEEEAFDKYLELRIAFLEQEENMKPPPLH